MKTSPFRSLIAATFLVGISAYSHAKPSNIEKVVESFISTRGLQGLGVAIQSPKVKMVKWIKNPQIKSSLKVSGKTRFRVGSITKTFTSCLIHQMVNSGKIALDAPITRYLDDVPESWENITVSQLLQHTAGLFEYTATLPKPDYLKPVTFEEVIAKLANEKPKFVPGSQQEYSNTNYLLLGRILEKVSGTSYSDLVQKLISRPLKLQNTAFAGVLGDKNLVPGVRFTRAGVFSPASITDPTWLAAAGGIESSLDDMLKFSEGITSGKIFPLELLSGAMIPPTVTKGAIPYGSGLILGQFNGTPIIGHNGKLEGYESFWVTSLDGKIKIVLLANSDQAGLDPLLIELLQRVFIP